MWLMVLGCAPSVDRAPEKAAADYCKRAEECALLQDGEREETCEPNTTAAFEEMWTEELCPDGFDRAAWKTCSAALSEWSCEDTLSGWGDIGASCGSRDLCP